MKKDKNRYLTVILMAVLLLAAWFTAGLLQGKQEKDGLILHQKQEIEASEEPADGRTRIRYQGQTWIRRSDRRCWLFIGVDQLSEQEAGTELLGNGGRADMLVLFLEDQESGQMQMLPISRDTMVDVDVCDDKGQYIYSGRMQLAMQHAFGDSPAASAWLTVQKVEELLYGIEINGYLSLTMDGIVRAVDSLEGLQMTIPEDWSEIDPAYTQGSSRLLSGKETEALIRFRDTAQTGSNSSRMDRQSWILRAFYEEIRQQSTGKLEQIYDSMRSCMETNMSFRQLSSFTGYQLEEEALILPGTVTPGKLHDEFCVEEEALRDMIIRLFYEPEA